MPPRSSGNQGGLLAYQYSELASHPLPWPAVIIDVRRVFFSPSLIDHLTTEIEDITRQMRLHQIKRWRYLSSFLDFIKLDPIELGKTVDTAGPFAPQSSIHGEGSYATIDLLIDYLHTCINDVRSNRIEAAADVRQPQPSGDLDLLDDGPVQSTVRVFFIADIEDPNSLSSAATYAALLRQRYTDRPERLGRDDLISPVVICINANPLGLREENISYGQASLLSVQNGVEHQNGTFVQGEYQTSTYYSEFFTSLISTIFDMTILIYPYRDDEGAVNKAMQLQEAEFLLYTLLFSPESLDTSAQEMSDGQASRYLLSSLDPQETGTPLPGDLCIMGISSYEYSARWATRWLDYSLVEKLLHYIHGPEIDGVEGNLVQIGRGDWFDGWWSRVRDAMKRMPIDVIAGFKGLSEFEHQLKRSPFDHVPLRDSHRVLRAYCQEVASRYIGKQGSTLEQAFMSVEQVMPLLKKLSLAPDTRNIETTNLIAEQLKHLKPLQQEAKNFSVLLFHEAKDALRRAIDQMSALETRIVTTKLETLSRCLPELLYKQETFEAAAKRSQDHLNSHIKLWRLPLFGRVLQSTFLSLLLVGMLIFVLWFMQGWLQPSPFTISLPILLPGLSLFRITCIVVLLLTEFFYLSRRNYMLRTQRDVIAEEIQAIARAHIDEVYTSVAAKVALLLLQDAGLYHPDRKSGHFKQKLRTFNRVLLRAQEKAAAHKKAAGDVLDARILTLKQVQPGGPVRHMRLQPNSRKEMISWDQLLELDRQLERRLITNNPDLNQLVKLLLYRLTGEQPPAQEQGEPFQFPLWQDISTELSALLMATWVVDTDLATLHPQLERYITLEQQAQYPPSLLSDLITELYNAIQVLRLEQAKGGRESLFGRDIEGLKKPIEQILAAWVEVVRIVDGQAQDILCRDGIIAYLREAKIKIADAVDDLRRRCRLLGYHDELINSDDAYILLVSGPINAELVGELVNAQSQRMRVLPFPDQEKLIYLRVYRIRPG